VNRSGRRDPLGESDRRRRNGNSSSNGTGRPRRRTAPPDGNRAEATDQDQERPRGRRAGSDERAGRRRADDAGQDPEDAEPDDDEPAPERPRKLTAPRIARMAAEQVMEMTKKESESVTSVRRAEDGWVVGLEVVESRRIPESTDLLASYEAEMDADGDLVSYRRIKRYTRGRGDDE
jgi:hypothetical protein